MKTVPAEPRYIRSLQFIASTYFMGKGIKGTTKYQQQWPSSIYSSFAANLTNSYLASLPVSLFIVHPLLLFFRSFHFRDSNDASYNPKAY